MNKTHQIWPIFLMLFFSSTSVYAGELGCEDATKVAFRHFKLGSFFKNKHELDRSNIVTQDCKIWPADKNILLLAIIYNIHDDPSNSVKKSIVVMVDIPSRQVVSSYQGTIYHDGTICTPTYLLKLDTAVYQLAPEVRAFGYRIANPGSCPKCIQEDDKLTLFVREGEKLRPVLVNLAMQRDRTLGGCMGFERSKDSYMEVAFLTLGVEKTHSHGYADLLLKTKIGYASSTGERKFQETKPVYYLLHYDGEQYKSSEKYQPWWVWFGAER